MRHFIMLTALTLITAVSFVGVSYAASCYTKAEAEAEQGIRIHSELMVIGLNCAHMADANGNNLYLEHKKFTQRHEKLFGRYEDIMMAFMRKDGTKDPTKAMHALRTTFANKVSTDAAKMRPDIFCKNYASRIERATTMDQTAIRKWAATPFPQYPVSKPMCQ